MIQNIEIPREVPLMALSDTVLFPQAIMPLFVFEPHYKKMLDDVLMYDRIFAVATLDERASGTEDKETFHPIAGIGVIRACKQNPDGNSNLILQGIARIRFESITSEGPYRKASIREVVSEPDGTEEQIISKRKQLIRLIQTQRRLGASIPQEIHHLLSSIEDPESMLDLAIYTLCPSTDLKLELLGTRSVALRFEKFARFLEKEIQQLKLNLQLKGKLADENIGNN